MNIDFSKISNVSVADVDMKDYPDFCDAYIEECEIDGRLATDEELDVINDNSDFVYEAVMDYVF